MEIMEINRLRARALAAYVASEGVENALRITKVDAETVENGRTWVSLKIGRDIKATYRVDPCDGGVRRAVRVGGK